MTLRQLLTILVCLVGPTSQVFYAGQSPELEEVQLDALQCWRDIAVQSTIIGEPFAMLVTCAVVETDTATTVPNEVALAPETIDVSPFEVIEGQRFTDVRDGPWRYFQYQYRLRIIDEEFFGQDVEIPALELQYHIERTLGEGSTLPGRELRYTLPPHTIRIVSLVPDNAEDILEPSVEAFNASDETGFRADLVMLVAGAFGLVAIGFLMLALVQLRRVWRGAGPKEQKLLAPSVVIRSVLNELTALQKAVLENGWNPELVSRTLTALRVASAVALASPIVQTQIGSTQSHRDGQLRVESSLWRRKPTAVSSAITKATIAKAVESRRHIKSDDPKLDCLEILREALNAFTVVRYARNDDIPTAQMTTELDQTIAAIRPLRFRTLTPVQHMTRFIESIQHWRYRQ